MTAPRIESESDAAVAVDSDEMLDEPITTRRQLHLAMAKEAADDVIALELKLADAEYEEAMLRANRDATRRRIERLRHVLKMIEWREGLDEKTSSHANEALE